MSKLAWLTVDSVPSTTRKLAIEFPDDDAWLAILRGALLPLCYESNFEQHGILTPLQMSDTWTEYILDFFSEAVTMIPIGAIMQYGGLVEPDGWLFCDGRQLFVVDYPLLGEVLGQQFGSSDLELFTLPDLRGRLPLGRSDSHSMGTSGGAETHTLTTGQMPSHSHGPATGTQAFFYQPIGGSGGTVGWVAGGTMSTNAVTGNTGSGQAHNNMPPYQTLNYIIKC